MDPDDVPGIDVDALVSALSRERRA